MLAMKLVQSTLIKQKQQEQQHESAGWSQMKSQHIDSPTKRPIPSSGSILADSRSYQLSPQRATTAGKTKEIIC
jgi:hypothetical protein